MFAIHLWKTSGGGAQNRCLPPRLWHECFSGLKSRSLIQLLALSNLRKTKARVLELLILALIGLFAVPFCGLSVSKSARLVSYGQNPQWNRISCPVYTFYFCHFDVAVVDI